MGHDRQAPYTPKHDVLVVAFEHAIVGLLYQSTLVAHGKVTLN